MSFRRFFPRGRPPWLYVALLLAAVTVVSGIPYFVAGRDARRPEIVAVPIRLALPAGITLAQLQEARVESVVDGDTIDVILDGKRERVRYFGVDTPERGQRCFREATDRNTALIGKTVLLLGDSRDQDSFGRSLRYIFRSDGLSIDATLVAEGFGHAWQRDGRYRDQIVGLETEAQAAERGCLWK